MCNSENIIINDDVRCIKEENGVFTVSAVPGAKGMQEAMLNSQLGALHGYISSVLESRLESEYVKPLEAAITTIGKAMEAGNPAVLTREAELDTALLANAAECLDKIMDAAEDEAFAQEEAAETERGRSVAFLAIKQAVCKFSLNFAYDYLFGLFDQEMAKREYLVDRKDALQQVTAITKADSKERGMLETTIHHLAIDIKYAEAMIARIYEIRESLESTGMFAEGKGSVCLNDVEGLACAIEEISELIFKGMGFTGDYRT